MDLGRWAFLGTDRKERESEMGRGLWNVSQCTEIGECYTYFNSVPCWALSTHPWYSKLLCGKMWELSIVSSMMLMGPGVWWWESPLRRNRGSKSTCQEQFSKEWNTCQGPESGLHTQHTLSGSMMTWAWRAEGRIEKGPVRLRESGGL